jgi:N-acetyl-anhydromuramyl-L-alanine amidase AmpD
MEHEISNPYLGLRPFTTADSLYFFGRTEHTVSLLERLHRTRFLALVGSSGCGKSSLVRAGLIPALVGGFLVQSIDRWRIAAMKPGVAPLFHLAEALLGNGAKGPAGESTALAAKFAGGQVAAAVEALNFRDDARTNVLLLVDQFEEIFAFREGASRSLAVLSDAQSSAPHGGLGVVGELERRAVREAEADDFVALLLGLASSRFPVYVVVTMRSDYIGDCELFEALPEALNRSQYLIPRLTREQLRQAIQGPARLKGAELSPRLVDRLLNDIGEHFDQLPVLQHALSRTWDAWSQPGHDRKAWLDQEHYDGVGALSGALSLHAKEALDVVDHHLAARIFKCLTDTDPSGRRVRRSSTMGELARTTGRSDEQILALIDRFTSEGRYFIVRSSGPTREDERVEISHESLIRKWPVLLGWVDEERKDRDQLRELVRGARLQKGGDGDWLTGVALVKAMAWWREFRPEAPWAARYVTSDELDAARRYLNESWRRARRSRRLRVGLAVLALVVLVGAGARELQSQKTLADAAGSAAIARAEAAEAMARRAESEAKAATDSAAAAKRIADLQRDLTEQADARVAGIIGDRINDLEKRLANARDAAAKSDIEKRLATVQKQREAQPTSIETPVVLRPNDSVSVSAFVGREIQFVEARSHGGNRASSDLIVLHSTESANGSQAAQRISSALSTNAAFASSYHYVVDSDSIVQLVQDGQVAFHAPGVNTKSLGIGIVGKSQQTRAQWLASPEKDALELAARLTAALCKRWNIPVVFVDGQGLKNNERGITTHAEVSVAYSKSTHTDPGSNFPTDEFMSSVIRYRDAGQK